MPALNVKTVGPPDIADGPADCCPVSVISGVPVTASPKSIVIVCDTPFFILHPPTESRSSQLQKEILELKWETIFLQQNKKEKNPAEPALHNR